MPAIPVTGSPVKISGTASKPYLITVDPNSLSSIYLGQSSNVSTINYGVTLGPGSSITWQEITSEVWAVTDTGGNANVTVLYEASAAVSGSTSNLASVQPTLIQTLNIPYTWTTGSIAQDTFLDTQLIQQYAGVRIQVSVSVTNVATFGSIDLSSGAYIQFSGIQSVSVLSNSTTGVNETNGALWQFGDATGYTAGLMPAIQTYDFPVINTYLTSSWIRYRMGTTIQDLTGTITIRVYGLYNMVTPEERYQNYPGSVREPVWGVMYAGNLSSSIATEIPSQNGLASVTLATAAITPTTVRYQLLYWRSNAVGTRPIASQKLDTPGTLFDNKINTFLFPNSPVRLVTTFAGTGSYDISVIQTKK